MKNNEFSIEQIKHTGLFNAGDFDEPIFNFFPVPKGGKIANNTFVFFFIKDKQGNVQRYTMKIKTFFLNIKKVILKSKEAGLEILIPCFSGNENL